MREFILPIDLYCREVTVMIFDDSESMDNWLISNFDVEFSGRAYSASDGSKLYMAFNKGDVNINHITHESLHITYWVLEDCGIRLSDETQEAFCYLCGYLSEFLYNKLKELDVVIL